MGRRTGIGMVLALTLALPASAQAAFAPRPPASTPTDLTQTLEGPHFVVHYTSAPGDGNAVADADAQLLLTNAENAYGPDTQLMGTDPIPDSDGKTDIYVYADSVPALGRAHADFAGPTSAGWIQIFPVAVKRAETITHEFFHIVQFAIYKLEATWLVEGTARWATHVLDNDPGANFSPTHLPEFDQRPQVPLDCPGTTCDPNARDLRGYDRWLFFTYLSDHHGRQIVGEIFRDAAQLAAASGERQHPLQAIDDVLHAHGTSLSDAYTAFAVANMSGGYAEPELKLLTPVPELGVRWLPRHAIPAQTVSVDHLATKYIRYHEVFSPRNGNCGSAKLQFTVTLPPGVPTAPAFSAPGGPARPFTISGTTASAAIPWKSCGLDGGEVALPNGSLASDAQPFTITAKVIEKRRRHRRRRH